MDFVINTVRLKAMAFDALLESNVPVEHFADVACGIQLLIEKLEACAQEVE